MAAMEFSAVEFIGTEHVVFLNAEGDELVSMLVSDSNRDELVAIREQLLAKGELHALIHLNAGGGLFAQTTFVETFDDPQQPAIYALVTHPGRQQWIPVTEQFADRWRQRWR